MSSSAPASLAQARVPRYTSYPPATAFTPAVGAAQMAEWLGALSADEPVSLYAHVPFCRRLCWFCACRTQGTSTDVPLAPYAEDLLREIDLVSALVPSGTRAGQIHLGGGTPTILPPALLARLLDALRTAFPLADDAEIAVEIDPTVLDDERLDALAAAGLNRGSIGVQDFDEKVQFSIGRRQSVADTRFATDGLRRRGIETINFDLLYGLPHQTPASLRKTLDHVLELEPTRLALYGYAHVPWASRRQVAIPEEALPDPTLRLELFDIARERLERAGFVQVGIDHFAHVDDPMRIAATEGRLRRNFQGYTTDGHAALIGLGASSISRLPQGYAQNAPATAAWAERVRSGGLATARGHAFSGDDRDRGEAIERLLCDFALYPDRCSNPAAARMLALELLREWPWALRPAENGAVAIMPEGRPYARLIAATLDGYARESGRHSLAV
ncbi:oxygen-independent coproporphyrinogen III oxidase [Jannaschia aquimarina]|uniref:Coproporphyrinogen-III oxidase n=1 Tax=Jannaschia aquimarina TaxID=935700 RepID=A0A0D1EEG7_9RHOB|nr:oxygen-independent coproporphyrinogen III oxidase [Jannaschia aquimarina]KIT16104.1 Oxygen-independent coproporphyrinogen-III oxidase [Jannaschia aquimarina]SNT02478.1 oxygen-independent coproporphyrinogen-3 oxidase [Jannaschia aquimarina]